MTPTAGTVPHPTSHGVIPGIDAPAVQAAWDDFLTDGRFQASSRALYRSVATRFLRWLEPQGAVLVDVTPRLIEQFLDAQDVRLTTKGMYRTALRRFFDALAARGAIRANPADQAGRGMADDLASPAAPADEPPPLERLKRHVHELALDPLDEEDEDFEAALLMLAALHFGTRRVLPLSRHTGVPPLRAAEFACRLRANGVWTAGGKTAAAWLDPDDGNLAFWLDVWVATGLLEKSAACDPEEPDPDAVRL